jgi:hypothetical protein
MDCATTGNSSPKWNANRVPADPTFVQVCAASRVAAGRFLSHAPDLLERPRGWAFRMRHLPSFEALRSFHVCFSPFRVLGYRNGPIGHVRACRTVSVEWRSLPRLSVLVPIGHTGQTRPCNPIDASLSHHLSPSSASHQSRYAEQKTARDDRDSEDVD